MDLREIARAWMSAARPTKQQAELANKRLSICQSCPSMIESVVFKYKCKECGCPIGKKIYTPKMGTCDLHKWDKIEGL